MAKLEPTFTKNQAMQAASFLAKEHGFEPGALGAQGMVKIVDDQHALTVSLDSKTMSRKKASDDAAEWNIGFAFARRDLNEHLLRWLGEPEKAWFDQATVVCMGDFVTDQELRWAKDVPFEAKGNEVESAVVSAVGMANLATIEANLYEPNFFKPDLLRCVVNDALNGVDRIWDEYLVFSEEIISGSNATWSERQASFDTQLREFKAAYPDGIPR